MHLPELVERRRQEAARVGESYPSLEKLCEVAREEAEIFNPEEDFKQFKKFVESPLGQAILDL